MRSIAKAVNISPQSLNWWLDNLSILICVVKPSAHASMTKETPSTDGMRYSLETSELMKLKLQANLPQKHLDHMQ